MIFDSIKNKSNYKDYPLLYKALCHLEQYAGQSFPQQTEVLIEKKLFCSPVTLISKPESECIYEAHRNYIDVHYIVSGIEKIAIADISTLDTITPYSKEKDIEFLSGEADGYYELKPGQFMVCFPNNAHKVAIMKDQPKEIKKIVFKIITEDEK